MAKLSITINLDNEAFDPEPGSEVARILHYLADTLPNRKGITQVRIHDINGNTVGLVAITD